MLTQLFPLYTLFWWAADKGAGGGDSTNDTSTDEGNGSDNTSTDEGNTQSGDGATFTQDDLNRIAGKTKREARAQLLKDLGVERVEELQALIKARQEAEDKAKTDLDKAREAEQREKQRADQAEAKMYQVLLRSEFRVQAASQVEDLDLAYLAAQSAGLLNGQDGLVEVDLETGKVTGLDKVIEKLLKDKPLLKKASQAQAASTSGSEGSSGKSGAGHSTEQSLRARFGI